MRTRRDPIELGFVERARQLRRRSAVAERTAWRLLRNRHMLGLKFRRQHRIRGFIVDFYCAELRLVLEIDGPIHHGIANRSYDETRSAWLEARGIRVVRVRSKDVSEAELRRILLAELSSRPPLRL